MSRNSGGFFGKFKTGCLIVLVVAGVIYIALAFIQCAHDKSSKNVPDITKAPYAIQTDSRAYLAAGGQIKDSKGNVIMNLSQIAGSYTLKAGEKLVLTNWYDMVKDNWKYRKGNSPVYNKSAYSNIEITRRKQ